jgi:hypothetical protein
MGEKRAYKPRKPGGGRKKLKPEYDAGKNLKEQMDNAVVLYDSELSLQAIGEELGLNPIKVRKGRNGEYTKELWIDRRGKNKGLAWSSVLLALKNIKKVGEVVDRPKALGDIRGVTYIYGMFYRFGLIDVPDDAKEKMGHPKKTQKK